MLSENLKILREKNKLSQEDIASKLHVTRQTISKWERSLSTPDADVLIKLSQLFNVDVSELLGTTMNEHTNEDIIAQELAQINIELATKNKRSKMWQRIILGILIGFVVMIFFSIILGSISYKIYDNTPKTTIEKLD